MKYISGIYALNLPSQTNTPGDWHHSALDWENIPLYETNTSVFGEYRISGNFNNIPVADHVRACLDLIENGFFGTAGGMREYYLENHFEDEIFDCVSLLQDSQNWDQINEFMDNEYLMAWANYLKNKDITI